MIFLYTSHIWRHLITAFSRQTHVEIPLKGPSAEGNLSSCVIPEWSFQSLALSGNFLLMEIHHAAEQSNGKQPAHALSRVIIYSPQSKQ